MSEVIDLDSIMPVPCTVRLGGKDIVINPPTVAQILVLVRLNSAFMEVDDSDYQAMQEASAKVQNHLRLLIPGLPDGEFNAFTQRKLIEALLDLSKPEDIKVLEDKGITVDSSKKAPQD